MSGMFEDRFEDAREIVGQPIEVKPIVAEASPFPVDALSPRLRDAVQAIVDIVQIPVSIAAQSVLGACSLVAQSRLTVELPTTEHVPASLFLFTVAASGDRKSTADKLALRPVYEREKFLRTKFEAEQLSFTIDKAAYDAALAKAKRDGGKDREQVRANLGSCGSPPIPPALPMLLVEDPTIEGVVKLLDEAYPALGLFSDEGAKMLGGYSMQDDKRASTGAALSQLWDGKPIKRVRGTDVTKFLAGRRMSLHLMVQPGVAMALFGDKSLRDQGMMSRLLVAYPKSLKGERFWREPTAEAWGHLEAYHSRLDRLLRDAFVNMDLVTRELTFSVATFQPDAREMWIKFSDHIERQQCPGGPLEEISDLASKIAQHAARLAAVISYFEGGEAVARDGISAAAMSAGIQLGQFYLSEALRLYNSGSVDEDSDNAASLIDFIRKRELKAVGMRWLSQRAPKPIRPAKVLQRAVEVLIDAGHLHPIKGGATIEIDGKSMFQKVAYTVIYGEPE